MSAIAGGLDINKERAALISVIQEHHRSIGEAKRRMRENPALKDDPGQWALCSALETMLLRCDRKLKELEAEAR